MTTQNKIKIAKNVCEFALGWTIGSIVKTAARPKGTIDVILTAIGAAAISYTAGCAFEERFDEFCDAVFGAETEDEEA